MSRFSFKETIDYTNRKMVACAESENWDELLSLSENRDKLIRCHFDDHSLQYSEENVRRLSESIKVSDNLITQRIKLLKNKMINSSLNLRNTQTAISSYKKTQENPSD